MYFPHNEIIMRHDGLAAVRAAVALLPPSSSVEQIIVAEQLAGIGAIKTTPVTAYITPTRITLALKTPRARYGKPSARGLGDVVLPEKEADIAIALEESGGESKTGINLMPGGYTPEEIRASKVWKRHMRVTITERAPGVKMYLDTDLGSGTNIRRMKKRVASGKHPILEIIYPKVLNKQPLTGAEALYHIAVILRRKRRRRRHKAKLKKSLTGVIIVAAMITATIVTFGTAPLVTGLTAAGDAVVTAGGLVVAGVEATGGALLAVPGLVIKGFDALPEKTQDKIIDDLKDEVDDTIEDQKKKLQEEIDAETNPPPDVPGAAPPAVIKKPLSKAAKTAIVAVPAAGILGTLAWFLIRR